MATSKISAQTRVVRSQEFVAADMDDDLVMMSLENNNYYSLDAIGKTIWALLEEPVLVSDLIDRLTQDFEVNRGRCLDDVLAFLDELEQAGLVQRAAPGPLSS
ncbi:MAG: lasso peptide biosynthesis PqqD family chaperone [Acidobacteriota bacterium]